MRKDQRLRAPAPAASVAALRKRLREAGLGRLFPEPSWRPEEGIALEPGRPLKSSAAADPSRSAPPRSGPAPTGVSRLGGDPDLPPGLDWPSGRGRKPLTFLGQIRLEDISAFSSASVLPRKGWLWFFADTLRASGSKVDCAVLHASPKASALRRRDPPWDKRENTPAVDVLDGRALRFRRALSLPLSTPAGLDDEEEESYWSLSRPEGIIHRLLGPPDAIQLSPAASGRKKEVLFLQVDSDPRFDLDWGDNGRLFILIPEADLAKGDFSRCRAVVQSH